MKILTKINQAINLKANSLKLSRSIYYGNILAKSLKNELGAVPRLLGSALNVWIFASRWQCVIPISAEPPWASKRDTYYIATWMPTLLNFQANEQKMPAETPISQGTLDIVWSFPKRKCCTHSHSGLTMYHRLGEHKIEYIRANLWGILGRPMSNCLAHFYSESISRRDRYSWGELKTGNRRTEEQFREAQAKFNRHWTRKEIPRVNVLR